MSDENKSAACSVLKTGAVILGLVAAGYVINEVRKEYDKNVDDYNELLDFVNNHDFYEKKEVTEFVQTAKGEKADFTPQFEKVDEYVNRDGLKVNVLRDSVTGFKIYKAVGEADEIKGA